MRVSSWARWMVATVAISMAGCGNFWQPPSTTTSGCTTDCPTTASGNFYILNQTATNIVGYNIASGGSLTSIGNPTTLSVAPSAIAFAPGGGFLYVGTLAGTYVYTVNSSTGALTIANSGNVISTDPALAMQIDPSGKWLVVAGTTVELIAIPIDTSTGLLGTGGEQHVNMPAATVQQLTISPDGNNVFIAMGSNGTVIIPFNASNANPLGSSFVQAKVKNTDGSALTVAVDAQNAVFYVGETIGNGSGTEGLLRVFNYSALPAATEVSGSPYQSGGLAPHAILSVLNGSTSNVYVANWATGGASSGNVAAFTLTSTGTTTITYSLSSVSAPVAVGINPVALAADNTGTYLLAVSNGGKPDLAAFSFDATTVGALDSVTTSTTGSDPVGAWAIAAAP